jgi:6-phosphogluconate dehydrogenase
MAKADIGLVGLAVMGENLAMNMERNGFSVAVFNRSGDKTADFIKNRAAGKNILGSYSLEEFTESLVSPRKIMLMVKAGKPVDMLIEHLIPLLEEGDLIADGGNSHFEDTRRRESVLKERGIHYLGCGISGGEEGALNGPCIMPGGSMDAYLLMDNILTACAAIIPDGPCCVYLGPHGAGHYVKMVHNGIEYAFMQLIAEVYDILQKCLNLPAEEIGSIFEEWNREELSSYLVEITAKVLKKKDRETGELRVDKILDRAGQKGTGIWTSQSALELGVPVPTINAAVSARSLSGYLEERRELAGLYPVTPSPSPDDRGKFIRTLKDALYAAIILAYAQGMALLLKAGEEYGFNLSIQTVAGIWRGGCIIRAELLDRIRDAYEENPQLSNLMADEKFRADLGEKTEALRGIVKTATDRSIPHPALATSLNYFDSFRSERLPVNLIQAQRDYFGAHTYRRIDREGTFHTIWPA